MHILSGICAGLHRPNAANIADKMLFMVAAMAAEVERDLIRERTRDGLAAAAAQGRKGGRPEALDPDDLAVAQARRARGESVTAIAAHLKVGVPRCIEHCDPTATRSAHSRTRPRRRRRAIRPRRPPPHTVVPDGSRPVRARIRQPGDPLSAWERGLRARLVHQREVMAAWACPTCGNEPADAETRWR